MYVYVAVFFPTSPKSWPFDIILQTHSTLSKISVCFSGYITLLHDSVTFYFLLRGFKYLSQAEGIRK
jgi:hypothetical protein